MQFERITEASVIKDLIEFHNSNSEFVVLDVETTGKQARKCSLVDIQMSGKQENSAVIFSAELRQCLQNLSKNVTLVAHNYKFDAHVLFRHGVDLLDKKWRDTLLIGHLLDENRDSYSLNSYVKEYWGDDFKTAFWKEEGGKYSSYLEAPEEERIQYACSDIVYTGLLYRKHLGVASVSGLPESLIEHVHKLQASLLQTEIEGIRVDLDYLRPLGVRLMVRIEELRPQMRGLVKDEIEDIELEMWCKELDLRKTGKGKASVDRPRYNFESSRQLSTLLYSKLGLPVQRNEKTKAISTDYSSLEKLKEMHPIIGLIQENRELQKIYTSYVEGTLDRIDQTRIYPEFRVAGTVTGRLSHSNPNLAQLPKSGGIRGIYVPDPGRVFISADYSQLEVVLEANLTGDKNLIRMLENGESKHDLTARELGCGRDTAKTLNFALQYWAGHFKVAQLLGLSVSEGLNVWRKYWEIYSGPKELKTKTDKMVDSGIPIETLFGRKRRFPVRKRSSWDSDYRQAYNFLIQGTGADATSEAFYKTDSWLRESKYGKCLWTVHDELMATCSPEFAEEVQQGMIERMCQVGHRIGLKIPLKAQGSGPCERWED